MSVRLFEKKETQMSHASRRLGQADDQGMSDGKGVHTVRDSCYHREKGAEKT